ncbi:MAG TPA: PTS system mannose/fructose/sorbose family transporter subunit IID [Symbiobacteriaceae bacterium]
MTVSGEAKRLSKRELNGMWLRWIFFNLAAFSMERMQAIAFVHMLSPLFKKYYTTKEELRNAVTRHLSFFNTEPQVGALIGGIVTAMEEERARGAEVPDEAIQSVKVGLMGPLAGIGDSLIQGTLIPILLSIGIALAANGSMAGPIFYFVSYLVAVLGTSNWLFHTGYRYGVSAVESFLSTGQLQYVTESLAVMGLTVAGAVTASVVSLKTKVAMVSEGKTAFELQSMLDGIMPGLLPLALTLLLWWLMARKGLSANRAILLCLVLAVVGVLIGVF